MSSSNFSDINLIEKSSLAKFTNFFFITFIYTSIILPSGSIFGVNIKLISLIFFLFSLIIVKKSFLIFDILKFLFPIILFLIFEIFYSFVVFKFDSSFILAQAKDIFVFFLMFSICVGYAKYLLGFERVANIIINAVFLVGLIKISIILYSFISGIQVSTIITALGNFFGVSIMTFDVENSSISRINFTSDSILAISIFYLFMKAFKHGVTVKSCILILVVAFSALITMSRFQWAACLLSVTLVIIINLHSRKSLFVLLFMVFISVFTLSFQSTQELISTRFDQRIVSASDIERTVQQQKIFMEIEKSPILGNGLGYYIPDVIRSYDAKYSYELQLPALVMQLGIIGFLYVLLMIIVPLFLPLIGLSLILRLCFILLISIWLSGAMFNPILFSSSAGITMAFLNIISRLPWMSKR